jgi:Amt family ammonium transporter
VPQVVHCWPRRAGSSASGVNQPSAPSAGPASWWSCRLNLLWIIIGAALVIFMQAGFAMVETGFCRSKHAAHVVTTNLAIFGLGFVGFFFIGFPLMFGGYSYAGYFGFDTALGSSLIGSGSWTFAWWSWDAFALSDIPTALLPSVAAFFLYMVAFMDTTATIPTGSMAERWKWKSFVRLGPVLRRHLLPALRRLDLGWRLALAARQQPRPRLRLRRLRRLRHRARHGRCRCARRCDRARPRIGKFGKDGTPRALPGHNIPMAMLGTFILLFGWFGFNAASTFAATDVQFATVAANTGHRRGLRPRLVHVLRDHQAPRASPTPA